MRGNRQARLNVVSSAMGAHVHSVCARRSGQVMRESLAKLELLCLSSTAKDQEWSAAVEDTRYVWSMVCGSRSFDRNGIRALMGNKQYTVLGLRRALACPHAFAFFNDFRDATRTMAGWFTTYTKASCCRC